jgi:hypothetical protein
MGGHIVGGFNHPALPVPGEIMASITGPLRSLAGEIALIEVERRDRTGILKCSRSNAFRGPPPAQDLRATVHGLDRFVRGYRLRPASFRIIDSLGQEAPAPFRVSFLTGPRRDEAELEMQEPAVPGPFPFLPFAGGTGRPAWPLNQAIPATFYQVQLSLRWEQGVLRLRTSIVIEVDAPHLGPGRTSGVRVYGPDIDEPGCSGSPVYVVDPATQQSWLFAMRTQRLGVPGRSTGLGLRIW